MESHNIETCQQPICRETREIIAKRADTIRFQSSYRMSMHLGEHVATCRFCNRHSLASSPEAARATVIHPGDCGILRRTE